MSIAVLTMFLGMFAIPWTTSGLIHPPAAGMRGASRWKILGFGSFALVALLALSAVLSGPAEPDGAKTSDAESAMAVLWFLSCIAWPFAALVLRTKGKAKTATNQAAGNAIVDYAPAERPLEADKPRPLSTEQRKSLNLQEREPSEVARQRIEQPAPPAAHITARTRDDQFAHLCPDPVDPRTVSFLYENAQGEISSRTIDVDQVGTSHFAGFCHMEGDNRTFRFDRILGMATLDDSGKMVLPENLRDLLRGYDEQELRRRKRAAAKTCSEILFTGFKKDRRAELEDIAQAAGMVVRKNVTANLDFLCAGSNAGPTKIAEALDRGVMVLDEQQLLRMLETGEVPA
jgi:hypothetical protein